MTNEEVITYIKQHCYGEWCEDEWREVMDAAIKALEQKPYQDAISRQAAINIIDRNCILGKGDLNSVLYSVEESVMNLPFVQPEITLESAIEYLHSIGWMQSHDKQMYEDGQRHAQPERKRGKWIWMSSTYDRNPCEMRYMCSECHHETILHSNEASYPWEKFCPNCGTKMEEGD